MQTTSQQVRQALKPDPVYCGKCKHITKDQNYSDACKLHYIDQSTYLEVHKTYKLCQTINHNNNCKDYEEGENDYVDALILTCATLSSDQPHMATQWESIKFYMTQPRNYIPTIMWAITTSFLGIIAGTLWRLTSMT